MNRHYGILSLSAALLLATACDNSTQVQYPKEELPVSRVVMYQSGIGYIERNAMVKGDELVLRIRPDQINDILKSLTIIDRGNGRPVSISLPVDRDTLNTLSQIPDQIRDGGIRSLLEAFRGAHVSLRAKGGSCEGRIVGVEQDNRPVALGDETIEDEATVTLLNNKNALEVFRIRDIKSVTLHDQKLADGLSKSLSISLNEGNWKQVELRIRMDSAKERELALSYIVAMPTWKPAYRLVLGDHGKGTLQGWAIISNVTGADWNGITFSLVSGQPMSFTYDLYRPQFLSRPDLTTLGTQTAVAPVITTSGYVKKESAAAPQATRGYGSKAKYAKARATGAQKMNAMAMADSVQMDMAAVEEEYAFDDAEEMKMEAPAPITADEMVAGFTQLATNTQLGSFDEYKLAAKLTVPDGNTALVNLIQNEVTARDTRMFKPITHIFDYAQLGKGWRENESYQTIEMKNDLGVALDSGPITIFRDSAVIGEGYLSRTDNNATAYITFAKEGRLEVSVIDDKTDTQKRLKSFKRGVCSYDIEEKLTHTFEFSSHVEHGVTALLQIPRFKQWTPVDFPASVVTNDSAYVISADIPANGKVSIPITMSQTRSAQNTIQPKRRVPDGCYDAIKTALDAGNIPQPDLFAQFIADVDALKINQTKTDNLISRRNEIQSDQQSLTSTLAGLKDIKTPNANALRRQLVSRQQSNEKALVEITTELYALQVEKGELELKMQTYVSTMEYSR